MIDAVVQLDDFRSPELRLPLRQIKTLVSTLLRTDVDWDDDTRREYITRIDHEIDWIVAAVESLPTRTGQGQLQTLVDSGTRTTGERETEVVALSKLLEAALMLGAAGGNAIHHPAALLAREILAPPGQEELSDRELDVLRLIGIGRSNKQIAQELAITPNTVKTHVSSILGKLGVESRTQAALYMPGVLAASQKRSRIEAAPVVRFETRSRP